MSGVDNKMHIFEITSSCPFNLQRISISILLLVTFQGLSREYWWILSNTRAVNIQRGTIFINIRTITFLFYTRTVKWWAHYIKILMNRKCTIDKSAISVMMWPMNLTVRVVYLSSLGCRIIQVNGIFFTRLTRRS